MPTKENITAKGTIMAAMVPARRPRKTTTSTATTTKVWATLDRAELTEALT
jgi:antitoxin (DNA-binding transcriptional repressor) of toxin-antitoxin stability system